MAYTINLTNGAIFATIPDGTRDTSSSLVIIGKNYTGYGEFIGENFVKVLENHANTLPPQNPLTGQLWYDLTESNLKIYDSETFKTLGITTSSLTEPLKKVTGDMWYDTSTEQIKVYSGTGYEIVGPLYTSTTGKSGPIVETLLDTGSTEHVATVNYVAGNVVSIEHKDTPFTLHAGTPIAGFPADIYPGIQLATDVAGEVPQFTGTATNSVLLNNVDSDGYLSALNPDTTAGTLGVLNDGGLVIGEDSDLQLTITGADAFINNSTTDGRIVFRANPQGVPKDVITIAPSGAEARARVFTPLSPTDIANMQYVDDAAALLGTTKLSLDGSTIMTGNIDLGNFKIINSTLATTGTDVLSQAAGDARYLTKDISSSINTAGGVRTRFYNDASDLIEGAGESNTLQVYQPTAGYDAFMTFHIGGDYAVNLGLEGTSNDLYVGGWSMGATKYKIWHQGNDGPSSGLSAQYANYATTAGSAGEQFKFPRSVSRSYYTNYYNSRSYGIFVSVQAQNINDYRATLMLRISKSGYSTIDCRAMSWVGNGDHRTYGMWYVPAYTYYQLRNDDSSTRTIYQWVEWY